MIALQAVTPEELARAFPALAEDAARRVVSAVHRDLPVAAVRGVRRAALEALAAESAIPALAVRAEQRSAIDPFVKYALVASGGEVVETVRIPLKRAGRYSVCVSSQVGCALACAFCATGRMGLTRNLETWEIVEQVRVVRRGLSAEGSGARVHGVVFQGMGEPMANLDRVLAAIRVMCDPSAMAIDARAMTVCTSGLPSGIRRLAEEAPNVRLGLSMASARPAVRRSLMPIDAAHPLADVLDAAAEHARRTRLAPMWAVTLLAGVNDTEEDGRALGALAARFAADTGVRPRISVIPYNAIDEDVAKDPFTRADGASEARFRAGLQSAGFGSHMRYSGGSDVNAACGQLAART